MKNFINKTVATVILLTVLTFNALACGDLQCPNPPCGDLQCPGVSATVLLDETKNNSSQKVESLSDFIVKMCKEISFLF